MTPGAAVKKRRKFDLKTFLSTIDGGRTIAAAPKKHNLCSGRLCRFGLLYSEGKGKTHSSVE
jgi:hypothetical protein